MFLFLLCSPIFLLYFILCFFLPLIKFGKIKKSKGVKIYIVKDAIHSDYLFESELKDFFPSDKKYTKVGWGDKKIFLETQSWKDLKAKDFVSAFFGMNNSVLRVQFLDEIPKDSKEIEIDNDQLETIKNYIKRSYNGNLIVKRKEYYQIGDYYESDLNYNCITNCNNWVNVGLRLARVSNRIWCPLSLWV